MLAIMRVRILGEAFISSVHNEGQRCEVRNQDIRVVELREVEYEGQKRLYDVGMPFILRRQWHPNMEGSCGLSASRGVVDFDELIDGDECFVQVDVSMGHEAAYCWGMYRNEEAFKAAEMALYSSLGVS